MCYAGGDFPDVKPCRCSFFQCALRHALIMTISLFELLFLANIRGWQLIIIVFVVMFFIVVPALFGFVLGRRSASRRQRGRHKYR